MSDPTLPLPDPAPAPAPPAPGPATTPPTPDPTPVPPPPLAGPAPTPPPPGRAPDPVIAQIGEILVTSTSVRTPAGEFPLRGTTWQVTELWLPEQKTPTWAIVLTIVGFFVVGPFSLLFLLVRQTVYRGVAQVTVNSWTHQYVARIPVTDSAHVQYLQHQVNYVRSLAAL